MKKYDRKYLAQLQRRYAIATKSERKIILGEFSKTSNHEKQYAGKLLRGNYRYATKPIKRPRRKIQIMSVAMNGGVSGHGFQEIGTMKEQVSI